MKFVSYRTDKIQSAYTDYKATGAMDESCPLCKREPVKEFTYWKIIKNDFPYDKIAVRHDMLVSKRHVTEEMLTNEEKAELLFLKHNYISQEYTFITEVLSEKSIPDHFHIHLLIPKEITFDL